ncbi:hypothetical protein NDU88_007503 [Pleurodeles waltl]|uniref:Uncharacterized protein n=1 Tax=Pleurodeles waltl TaxID=8319 RepID=A0AAV7SSG6_PLEWA|nr:hypothetical protein NDU88_007503 [Pleurodeles waltl]
MAATRYRWRWVAPEGPRHRNPACTCPQSEAGSRGAPQRQSGLQPKKRHTDCDAARRRHWSRIAADCPAGPGWPPRRCSTTETFPAESRLADLSAVSVVLGRRTLLGNGSWR